MVGVLQLHGYMVIRLCGYTVTVIWLQLQYYNYTVTVKHLYGYTFIQLYTHGYTVIEVGLYDYTVIQ